MSPQKSFTKFNLKDADAQLLKNQLITDVSPGSIVKDFNTLLDYIQSAKVEVTAENSHFVQKHLESINQRMTKPLLIKITRPVFHSYANLEGLYLLLRSTGMVEIINSKKEKMMKLNEKVVNIWRTLNPTEQYFSLFVTWLFRCDPTGLLGNYDFGRWPLLIQIYEFYEGLPGKGLQVDKDKNILSQFKYSIGYFNLALMRMFGLITIQEGEPAAGEGWRIIKILPTAYGNIILECLEQIFRNDPDFLWRYAESFEVPCNAWQPLFQPYFPKWQNSLTFPEDEFREGIFIFKVSLGNIWRRIEIDGQMTLEQLVNIILRDGFQFDKDHLYAFYYKNLFGSEVEIGCPYSETQPDTTEVRIGDIPLLVGAKMKFVFDFGDNWEFTILLEEIKAGKSRAKLPRIIEKHGKAPAQYPSWDDEEFF